MQQCNLILVHTKMKFVHLQFEKSLNKCERESRVEFTNQLILAALILLIRWGIEKKKSPFPSVSCYLKLIAFMYSSSSAPFQFFGLLKCLVSRKLLLFFSFQKDRIFIKIFINFVIFKIFLFLKFNLIYF